MYYIYARVSTAEQAAEGATSIDEQVRIGSAIATSRGADKFDIATFIDPGVSGSLPLAARPQGGELLAQLNKGDTLIATKLDRVFRNTLDAISTAKEFQEKGINLILVQFGPEPVCGNSHAKMFFGMLALVAEYERDMINERTQAGRAAKTKLNGHLGGQAPYGMRVVGAGRQAQLEPNPAEQEVIAFAASLRAQGMSDFHTARQLNKRGFKTRKGGVFFSTAVRNMLARLETKERAA
jgi:DNA invertase Pin-like site-specific DNA recombinase